MAQSSSTGLHGQYAEGSGSEYAHGAADYHGGGHHEGPHIMDVVPAPIKDFTIFGFEISPTILTTWLLIVCIFIFCLWLSTGWKKRSGLAFMTGVTLTETFYKFFNGIIENKPFTQKALFLLGGVFFYIITANIFSLFLDWILTFWDAGHYYLRPINSDLHTTLGLALVIILISHGIMIAYRGFGKYLSHYLFHFSGETIVDRIVNVAVGWLHLIGEGIRLLGLSMRLFGNIFGGATLIGVLAFLTGLLAIGTLPIGQILMLPFWLFELFIAFIQAFIFATLAGVYFKEAVEHH